MSIPFAHNGQHTCRGAVMTCIDFRFWPAVAEFIKSHFGWDSYDLITVPGAAKTVNEDRTLAIDSLTVSCELHQAKTLVIINHADCGAYGGAKRFASQAAEEEFHRQALGEARAKLSEEFNGKKVITIFARLDDAGQNIEFVEV